MDLDYRDDVNSSLTLMMHIDNVESQKIKKWFTRNLCLDEENICLDRANDIMGKHEIANNEFYKECLEQYRIFKHEDARGGVPDAPKGLESRLDGKSWRSTE